MNRRIHFTFSNRPLLGVFGPQSTPARVGRVKVFFGALLLAAVIASILVAGVILGSLIAAVMVILLVIAIVTAIVVNAVKEVRPSDNQRK